jgi:hypothetical protein
MRHVLASLARRWLELHEETKVHTKNLKNLTKTAAPDLVAAFGIGPDIAARCSSPLATTTTASAPTPPWRNSAARALSQQGPAGPTDAIASTGAGTGRPTPPSTERSSSDASKRFLVRETYQLLPDPSSPPDDLAPHSRTT